ncbi:MAG: DoxX family protein [Actinocatenispora sp.]
MTATTPLNGSTPARRGAGNIVLWILQIVAVLGFLLAATQKLTGDEQVMGTFHALGWGAGVRYLLAGLEVLGAVALFIPRLTGLAATAFVALTIGAVVVQLATGGSVAAAVVLLVVSAVVAWGRRRSTAALWAAVRGRRRAPGGDA